MRSGKCNPQNRPHPEEGLWIAAMQQTPLRHSRPAEHAEVAIEDHGQGAHCEQNLDEGNRPAIGDNLYNARQKPRADITSANNLIHSQGGIKQQAVCSRVVTRCQFKIYSILPNEYMVPSCAATRSNGRRNTSHAVDVNFSQVCRPNGCAGCMFASIIRLLEDDA